MIFYFPEKPKRIYSFSVVPAQYIMQVKKNGWRVEIICDNDEVKLFNRHGERLSVENQFDWNWIKDIFPQPFYIDGEIVGTRQKGIQPDTIVVWDTIMLNGKDLKKLPYLERWQQLNEYASEIPSVDNPKNFGTRPIRINGTSLYISENYEVSKYTYLWNNLDKIYDEGIVFKNPNAVLNWNVGKTTHSVNQLKLIA